MAGKGILRRVSNYAGLAAIAAGVALSNGCMTEYNPQTGDVTYKAFDPVTGFLIQGLPAGPGARQRQAPQQTPQQSGVNIENLNNLLNERLNTASTYNLKDPVEHAKCRKYLWDTYEIYYCLRGDRPELIRMETETSAEKVMADLKKKQGLK